MRRDRLDIDAVEAMMACIEKRAIVLVVDGDTEKQYPTFAMLLGLR